LTSTAFFSKVRDPASICFVFASFVFGKISNSFKDGSNFSFTPFSEIYLFSDINFLSVLALF